MTIPSTSRWFYAEHDSKQRTLLISTKRAMEHPDLPSYLIDELLVEKAKTVRLIHRLEELIEQEQQLTPNEDYTHDKTSKRRNQHS